MLRSTAGAGARPALLVDDVDAEIELAGVDHTLDVVQDTFHAVEGAGVAEPLEVLAVAVSGDLERPELMGFRVEPFRQGL